MADYEVRQRETVVRDEPVVRETYVQREPAVDAQREIVEDPSASGRALVSRVAALIWLLFGALDLLLVVRFLLKFIAANPTNDFSRLIYGLSDLPMAPFNTLIASPVVGNGVFELPALIAIIVYTLAGWLIVRLFRLLFTPASTKHTVTTYRREL